MKVCKRPMPICDNWSQWLKELQMPKLFSFSMGFWTRILGVTWGTLCWVSPHNRLWFMCSKFWNAMSWTWLRKRWLCFVSTNRPQKPLQHYLPNKHKISLLRLQHKRPKGLDRILKVVPHHILQNKGEKKNVGDVVGFMARKIVLIFLGLPPTISTLANHVLITRIIVMTLTIILHHILSFNKFKPKWIM